MTLAQGTKIGSYEVAAAIGAGGLLCPRHEPRAGRGHHSVLNWTEELKRLVPTGK